MPERKCSNVRIVPVLPLNVSPMQINRQITEFAKAVGKGEIAIYNEFSLQHELGLFLRTQLVGCKIEFERNVSHFKLAKSNFEKKEIDIAVTSPTGERLSAIELKYPRNGQFPESMFSFCKDIAFLEQLVSSGFQCAYFLAVADHKLFYSGKNDKGIYGLFRSGTPITGTITKPTGSKDSKVRITGSYIASWLLVSENTKFCLIQIGS